jgi:hypothetical protein
LWKRDDRAWQPFATKLETADTLEAVSLNHARAIFLSRPPKSYNKKIGRVIGRVGYCHIDDVYFMFLCMGYFEWVSFLFLFCSLFFVLVCTLPIGFIDTFDLMSISHFFLLDL